MPEYLAPGVYVEEVSFRSKSIEGVSTSVGGFIGPTRFGPAGGPAELVTSFAEFSRTFGGLDKLEFADPSDVTQTLDPWDNYMAHAVRAFFDNGGTKLYVSRVYEPRQQLMQNPPPDEDDRGKASLTVVSGITLRARFPGLAGNMTVIFNVVASPNVLVRRNPADAPTLSGARPDDVAYLRAKSSGGPIATGLYDVLRADDMTWSLSPAGGGPTVAFSSLDPASETVHLVTVNVTTQTPGRFGDEETWVGLRPHPQARNSLSGTFSRVPASRRQYLETPFFIDHQLTSGAALLQALAGSAVLSALEFQVMTDQELGVLSPIHQRPAASALQSPYILNGGDDGRIPGPNSYEGQEIEQTKTGLLAFEDVDEISIVAAPGSSGRYDNPTALTDERAAQIVQALDIHCQRMRYRVSVLDSRDGQTLSEIREYRGGFDSKLAAIYYPWVKTIDPLDPDGRREVDLPPSGYVAGIYARNDVLHGVFKAPANEVVLGAVGFETLLNKSQQDILNPAGINCFRFFEGRGYRLWGARTISSDPEWKYVSVRRYFAYLEHSIDKGTQWAVFENNGPALWANVTQTITDFLISEWRNGALLGTKPDEAFFVRCDRSTMTQNDLDNGRLVCLIGVAVVKPAEYVIFRIGQMTADARR